MKATASLVVCLAVHLLFMTGRQMSGAEPARRVPVIYCTDLFHPHEDPDDHFDLATLYAMPEIDIRAIILDQGRRQLGNPGRIPVEQLNHITGCNVPAVSGLADPLKSPDDKALEQPPEFQQGVETILRILRTTREPVRISAVGSMRDLVAAFNREPVLFKRKVTMVMAFIGEASDPLFREYNVGLDPNAYIGLMRSGLPLYWVPCFDGGLWQNKGHASYCQVRQGDLLRTARPALLQYFLYALGKERSEPMAFLAAPINQDRLAEVLKAPRNLWCTAILGSLSGRTLELSGTNYAAVLPQQPEEKFTGNRIYGFQAVTVRISDQAVVSYDEGPGTVQVMRFEVRDPANFKRAMTDATADLLGKLGAQSSSETGAPGAAR